VTSYSRVYQSTKQGPLEIEEMPYPHLKHAAARLRSQLTSPDYVGPNDQVTLEALELEIEKRDRQKGPANGEEA